MRKQLLSLAAFAMAGVLTAVGLSQVSQLQAQVDNGGDFSHIQLVTYPNGLTGFFDENSGQLYLYDGQVTNHLMTFQLTELGAPIQRIEVSEALRQRLEQAREQQQQQQEQQQQQPPTLPAE